MTKYLASPLAFLPGACLIIGTSIALVFNLVVLHKYDFYFTVAIGLVCGFFGLIIGLLMRLMDKILNTTTQENKK